MFLEIFIASQLKNLCLATFYIIYFIYIPPSIIEYYNSRGIGALFDWQIACFRDKPVLGMLF